MLITKLGMSKYFKKEFIDKLCKLANVDKDDIVSFVPGTEPPTINKQPKPDVVDSIISKHYNTELTGVMAFNEYGVKIDIHSSSKLTKYLKKNRFGTWKATPYIVIIRRFDTTNNKSFVHIWNMSTAAVAKSITESYVNVLKTVNAIAKSNCSLQDITVMLHDVYQGTWECKHLKEINKVEHLVALESSNLVLQVGENFIYGHEVPLLKEFATMVTV